MAKAMMGGKCTCTPGGFIWMIIAVIVMGIGLYFVVGGAQGQWSGAASWQLSVVWYALGFLIWGIGKMFKMKGCVCPMHGEHC